jgi:hypothetical protein
MELVLSPDKLICPSSDAEGGDLVLDMTELRVLEARQQEVAIVSRTTAPELMQAFTNGYGIASRALIALEFQLSRVHTLLDERKAVVILDIAPTQLREKGLVRPNSPSGSEDQRLAVLALDPEYKQLRQRRDMIEAATEFMKTKVKSFEQSYQSVKRVYDSLSPTNVLANGAREAVLGGPVETTSSQFSVGKPRY